MEGVERRTQDRARHTKVNVKQRMYEYLSPSLSLRDGLVDEFPQYRLCFAPYRLCPHLSGVITCSVQTLPLTRPLNDVAVAAGPTPRSAASAAAT